MGASDIVQRRLVNQQLVRPRLATPAALVRWMGAVQAQDYRGSLWALGLRLPGASEAEIETAIAARAIVRTWPMRGTLHLVPAEDVRWMLALLTPRVIARSAGRYHELALDDDCFARSARLLTRAIERRWQLTRHEAYAVLERGGVSPAGQRGIHILGHLAQHGLICLGPRRDRQPTFVLLDDWVRSSSRPTREGALATLATRYFTSHGPATLQDFAWWSGLLVKDAQDAIAAAGSGLVKETRDGRNWWLAEATPFRKLKAPVAVLLPPWDEYIVAYKDRDAAVGHLSQPQERLKTVGSSLIVIDGRVRGSWKRTLAPGGARVIPEFWTALSGAERRATHAAVAHYARFVDSAFGVG